MNLAARPPRAKERHVPTPKASPQKERSVRYRVRFRDDDGRSCSRTFFDLEGAQDFCS